MRSRPAGAAASSAKQPSGRRWQRGEMRPLPDSLRHAIVTRPRDCSVLEGAMRIQDARRRKRPNLSVHLPRSARLLRLFSLRTARDRFGEAGVVRPRPPPARRRLPLLSGSGTPGDASEAAALVLATQEFVANGGGQPSCRRRRSAASPGRTGSRGGAGRRGWWRSIAAVCTPLDRGIEAAGSGPSESGPPTARDTCNSC